MNWNKQCLSGDIRVGDKIILKIDVPAYDCEKGEIYEVTKILNHLTSNTCYFITPHKYLFDYEVELYERI